MPGYSSGVRWQSVDAAAVTSSGGVVFGGRVRSSGLLRPTIPYGINLFTRLPFSSGTRVFYVDAATGSDSNAGTSEGAPWASLQDYFSGTAGPANNITPTGGDVVLVKDFPGQVANGENSVGYSPPGVTIDHVIDNKSGLSTDPVTVKAYPGHRPIIRGQLGISPGVPTSRCLRVRGGSRYWRFQGFEFPYSAGEDFPEGNDPCLYLTGATTGNLEFYDCWFHGATDGSGVLGELGCHDIHFINCVSYDNNDIRFTRDGTTGAQSHSYYLNGVTNWMMLNCIARDQDNGFGFQVRNGTTTSLIVNCIAVRCQGPGAEFAGFLIEGGGAGTASNKFVNCIAYDCDRGIRSFSTTGTDINNRARRNLTYLTGISEGAGNGPGSFSNGTTTSGVDWSSDETGNYSSPPGDNTVNTDPKLFNPGSSDFHLQSNSPAYQYAEAGYCPDFDYDGNPRTDYTIGPFRAPEEG